MSLPKNASPEEIREYFKGGKVRWVDAFRNNFVPEEIIFEFKARIWSGDFHSRVQEIVNMFVRENKQISDKMMHQLLEKTTINNLYDFDKVYDLPSLLLSKEDGELSSPSMSYMVTSSLYQLKNITLEYLERVLGLEIAHAEKFGAVRAMLTNGRSEVSPEVEERARKFLKESYSPEKMKATVLGNGWIEDDLFTVEEWVKQVSASNIINFFDSEYSGFTERSMSEEKLEKYQTPEIVELVVEKVLERNSTVENPKLPFRNWKWIHKLIKDHPKFSEIESTLMTDEELIQNKEISWNDIDVKIQDGKLPSKMVEIVLLRHDAPLWFTDKYQSKLLQMLVRDNLNQRRDRNIVNLMMSRGRGYHDVFSSSPGFGDDLDWKWE